LKTRLAARHLSRISRVVSDLDRAEVFYRDALKFHAVARGRVDPRILAALGCEIAADEVVMRLGREEITLVRFAVPGQPYPPNSRSNDLWFQHLAIVVADMDAAYVYLSAHPGWQPISESGPQLLPPSNGAVRAFKFRDPDGHPLELIWFPPGQGRPVWQEHSRPEAASAPFLGIDHTALAVGSTARSLRFYRGLGLHVADRSLNHGAAQSRLDGLADDWVRVSGLRPEAASGPGIELLGYLPPGRPAKHARMEDIATDWTTLVVPKLPCDRPCALRDPDGHVLVLMEQAASAPA